MVVQLRRQAGDIDGVELERQHFARQRAAGDDEDAARALAAARIARFGEDFGAARDSRLSSPQTRGSRS